MNILEIVSNFWDKLIGQKNVTKKDSTATKNSSIFSQIDAILEKIALDEIDLYPYDKNDNRKSKALIRISDATVLLNIVSKKNNMFIPSKAIENIIDNSLIIELFKKSSNKTFRANLISYIHDDVFLQKIVENDSDVSIRKIASERIVNDLHSKKSVDKDEGGQEPVHLQNELKKIDSKSTKRQNEKMEGLEDTAESDNVFAQIAINELGKNVGNFSAFKEGFKAIKKIKSPQILKYVSSKIDINGIIGYHYRFEPFEVEKLIRILPINEITLKKLATERREWGVCEAVTKKINDEHFLKNLFYKTKYLEVEKVIIGKVTDINFLLQVVVSDNSVNNKFDAIDRIKTILHA